MLSKELLKQKLELEKLISTIEEALISAPEGTLRIAHNGKRRQYYHRKVKKDIKGCYITKDNLDLVHRLAQKDYDIRLLKKAKENLLNINTMLTKWSDASLTDIFDNINMYRKELVEPRVIKAEDYVKKWLAEPYSGQFFSETDPHYFTKRGERVRSKSEIIIADLLADMKIPYKYECPIYLKNGLVRYPDFTILLPYKRELRYLEHCGMMDDEKYLNKFFDKILLYNQNGIVLGKNLLLTFESSNHVLDTRELKRVIESIKEYDNDPGLDRC